VFEIKNEQKTAIKMYPIWSEVSGLCTRLSKPSQLLVQQQPLSISAWQWKQIQAKMQN